MWAMEISQPWAVQSPGPGTGGSRRSRRKEKPLTPLQPSGTWSSARDRDAGAGPLPGVRAVCSATLGAATRDWRMCWKAQTLQSKALFFFFSFVKLIGTTGPQGLVLSAVGPAAHFPTVPLSLKWPLDHLSFLTDPTHPSPHAIFWPFRAIFEGGFPTLWLLL